MKENTYSPVILQYISIKKKYPNAILLYRMGDFYEMFFEDAKKASKILDITLTKKINKKKNIPMAGIPFHSINNHIRKIVQLGIHVVICEQTGHYNKKKKLINRKVVQVITPGTITDVDLLNHNQSNFIMSILKIKNAYYCAYSDVMSGEFFIFFCLSQEKLELEIFKIQPKEVISHQNSVVEALNIHNITTIRSPWEFEKDFSLNKVNNQFKFSYLNIFKNQHHKLCLRAAGALISYLEYTQCGKLEHLKNMNIESQENNLNIDAMTIKNLELVKNINGEKENSLLHLINKCKTSIGSRLMNKWILNPISNQNILKKRYQAINSLKKDNLNEIIRDILSNIKDIDRILSKISFYDIY